MVIKKKNVPKMIIKKKKKKKHTHTHKIEECLQARPWDLESKFGCLPKHRKTKVKPKLGGLAIPKLLFSIKHEYSRRP